MTDPKTLAHELRQLHRVKTHAMTAPGGRVVYSIHGTDETLRPLTEAASLLDDRADLLALDPASGDDLDAMLKLLKLPRAAGTHTNDAIRAAAKQVQEIDLLNPYWCGAVQHLCDVLGVKL